MATLGAGPESDSDDQPHDSDSDEAPPGVPLVSDSDSDDGVEVGRAGALGLAGHAGAGDWTRSMVNASSSDDDEGVDIDLLADSDAGEGGRAELVPPPRKSHKGGVDRRQLEQHEAMVRQLLAKRQ